jgi:hypothetical protein
VIDCPPSLGQLTRSALAAADRAVLVTDPTMFAVSGVQRAFDAVQSERQRGNPDLQPLGVLINRVRPRNAEHEFRIAELRELFGPLVLPGVLPDRSAIQQAQGAACRSSVGHPRRPGGVGVFTCCWAGCCAANGRRGPGRCPRPRRPPADGGGRAPTRVQRRRDRPGHDRHELLGLAQQVVGLAPADQPAMPASAAARVSEQEAKNAAHSASSGATSASRCQTLRVAPRRPTGRARTARTAAPARSAAR